MSLCHISKNVQKKNFPKRKHTHIQIKNAQVNDLRGQNSNNRILQSDGGVGLETKWRVDKPTFAYDALNFELVYTISDFVKIGNSRYTVFDGHQCQEGDKDITTTQQYLTSTVVEDDVTPVGDGSGLRTIKVSLTIHPDQITTSPIYEESESTHQGFVYFCVRFGVWQTSDFNAFEPLEVNFIETPVLLIVDLVDDIAIEASTLTDADKIVESAQKGSAVNGYICDSEDNLVTQTTTSKTQGSSVKVCVEPTTKVSISKNAIFLVLIIQSSVLYNDVTASESKTSPSLLSTLTTTRPKI